MKQLFLALSTLTLALTTPRALANPITPDPPAGINYREILSSFFYSVVSQLEIIAAIVAVLFVVYYGYQYLTAAGNADQTKTARSNLINAVIGVIIIVVSITIIRLAGVVSHYLTGLV